MPNILAHIGVQGVTTRALIRKVDLKWIYIGCIIPDLPWILERVLRSLAPEINPYDLRLYSIVQSSLAACLLLCGALAVFSASPRRIFAVLAINSTIHLLLDACQTKFANGVHLFAPFSWKLLDFGFFWPESLPTHSLTALGIVYFVYTWRRRHEFSSAVPFESRRRILIGAILASAYLLGPFAFLSGPESMDNHSVKTLREREARPGRAVEFDRNAYIHREKGDALRTFAGEELAVSGPTRNRSGRVSVRAKFVDEGTIFILEIHDHPQLWLRDLASYVGLALVALIWLDWIMTGGTRAQTPRGESALRPTPAGAQPQRR